MAVEASIILEFGKDVDIDETDITIELDDQHFNNLDNEGNVYSSFPPSTFPVFLIQYDNSKVRIEVKSTDGFVEKIGINQNRERKQEALFAKFVELDSINEDVGVDTGYLFTGSLSSTFRGNASSLILDNDNRIKSISQSKYPCVADCTFITTFQEQYELRPPSMNLEEDETYAIYVVVYVEKV